MKIVTDTAANISPQQAIELGVEVVPFKVTFMDKTYRDGVDITPEALYALYRQHSNEFPLTSTPSAGDFVTAYEALGDEDILSIHLSSGLSGTYSAAYTAAGIVTNPNITVIDSKTVGPALGWMVEMAAYGIQHGWSKQRILDAMMRVKEETITMVAFTDIKYLIHSGRVNHLQAIVAAILKIKPIIGMNEVDGRYKSLGYALLLGKVAHKMAEHVLDRFGSRTIRLQLMHGSNLNGVEHLREAINGMMNCIEDNLVPVSTVLGAHAGPTVFGLAAMPAALFDELTHEAG
jgi:DegV family protein with EDD domain